MALTQEQLNRILGKQSVVDRVLSTNAIEQKLNAPENIVTGGVLPIQKNKVTGQMAFAMPEFIKSMQQAYTAPARAMRGEFDPNSVQGVQEANNIGLNLLGLGQTAPIVSKGATAGMQGGKTLSMFIGEKSPAWNKEKANLAIKLEKDGLSPEQIWEKTGTVRGAEGSLRQEINDAPAKFNTAQDLVEKANQIKLRNAELKQIIAPVKNQKDLFPKQLTEAKRPFKQEMENNLNLLNKNYGLLDRPEIGNYAPLVVEYPELYKAYPDMERIIINQGINKGQGNYGAYYPSKDLNADSLSVYKAALEKTAEGNPNWGGKSTSLHELQHAIQERENFARGGSTDEMLNRLLDEKDQLYNQVTELNKQMSIIAKSPKMTVDEKNAYDMLMEQRMQIVPRYQQLRDPQFVRDEAFKQYQRLGGEAESRLTQNRMSLTPEERLKYFPYVYNKEKYGLDVPFNELTVEGLLGN
jgi:hypothetical protein